MPGSGVYDLYGVVNHTGSLQFGHYYAYCYHEPSERWMNFNDSSVTDLPESQVVTTAAYVLFYKRRGHDKVIRRFATGACDEEFEAAAMAKIVADEEEAKRKEAEAEKKAAGLAAGPADPDHMQVDDDHN